MRIRPVAFFLAVLLVALLVAFAPSPLAQPKPAERFFQVEASQYAFTPAVLKVNPGDQVTIELVSTDVVHGLYLDGYDLKVMADPGQTATLSFIANQSGVFRFRCSVTCGDLHPFMIGKLYVGSNTLFWRGLGLALLAVLAVVAAPRSE